MSVMELTEINRNNVYKSVYKNKSTSKKQIMTDLNMSAPTISKYIDELIAENLLIYDGFLNSTGGRKAQSISCNYSAFYSIGIDITPNRLGVVLVDLEGMIKDTFVINIPFQDDIIYYQKITEIIKDLSSKNHMGNKILGVGVSLPAILDKSGRKMINSPFIDASNLTQSLEDCLKLPVRLFNDANAGGLGELWYLKSTKNMVYLSLSNTVGSAIILNGKLYYGDDSLSGEVGHMTLYPNGNLCYCGKRGCVNSYCSALALTSDKYSLTTFFEKLNNQEPDTMSSWNIYLDNLSIAINNVHSIMNCKVILGGFVGEYLQNYIQQLRDRVSLLDSFGSDTNYIQSCTLKNEASATGAALYFIELFINSI